MTYTLARTALAVALVAGPAAPAAAADKETRQMMADIRMLQQQSQELQNLLGSVTGALKALDGRLDQQTETNRKSFADQKLTIDAVAGDLRIVRERMDDNNVRIGSLTQEVDALRQTVLQLNVASPVAVDPADPSAASAGAAAIPKPAAPGIGGGLSPQKAFDMAKADYMIGQYELAISGLEGYVRDFPKSEQAGEAQLYVGNAFLQLGKYDKAVEAYDLTIRTYPKNSAIAEAYYRKGLASQNLRQGEAARAAFETVIKNYPDSLEATLAKQGLDKLSPRKP
jgi:tol-pal system protein YbgF